MKIQEAYTRWSSTYDSDRNLTRDLDADVTRAILGALAPNCCWETIVELGCGTGKNTVYLAEIGRAVRAFDFSPGMIRQARAKVQATNVTFQTGDLTQPWDCGARSADLVVGNLVLEHIAGLDFIFAEAARILQPGGYFFISELHPFRQYQGKKAVFQHAGETIEIGAYVHHISDFLEGAMDNGLTLAHMQEWWHAADRGVGAGAAEARDKPPRLVTFLFAKRRD